MLRKMLDQAETYLVANKKGCPGQPFGDEICELEVVHRLRKQNPPTKCAGG